MKTLFETFDTDDKIILPLLSSELGMQGGQELELYARFMRHLRHVPNGRIEIKILSAIQFTADMLGYSDAHVTKELVDLGLRAPRIALTADFLRFADESAVRPGWEVGAPSAALQELKGHWDAIGEDKFAAFKVGYPLVSEGTYV